MPSLQPGTPAYNNYIQAGSYLAQNQALAARAQQPQAAAPSQPHPQGSTSSPPQGSQGCMSSPGYNFPGNSAGGGQQPCQGACQHAGSGGQGWVLSHVVSGVVYYRPA